MADQVLIDPLGRRITLHDHTWYGHIVKGHPEIGLDRQLVCDSITSPVEIRFSRSDSRCRLYFGAGPIQRHKMLVVADVQGGYVKTAHLARRITGGDREWPT